MTSPVYRAVVVLVAQDEGFDPRHCRADQAARTWAVVNRVLELRGCSQDVGRFMARTYLETCLPPDDIAPTLAALEEEAARIATPAFCERVRLLAPTSIEGTPMRWNPISRQSKRQRQLLKEQLARIVPLARPEPRPLWSIAREPGRHTSRPPSRSRRSNRPF